LNKPVDLRELYRKTANRRLVNALAMYASEHNKGKVTYKWIADLHEHRGLKGRSGLLVMRNFGQRCYEDLSDYLAEKGIRLSD